MKKSFAVVVATATATNRCACTDAVGNFNLQDADLFAPASTVVQTRTVRDGLGRKVQTIRSVSPASSPVRVIRTSDGLLGTTQTTLVRQKKSNLGLDYALDAPGVEVLGVTRQLSSSPVATKRTVITAPGSQTITRVRSISPATKRTTITRTVQQPEDEFFQLGATRDARFASKVVSVGGRRPTSVVTVTREAAPASKRYLYVVKGDADADAAAGAQQGDQQKWQQQPPMGKRGQIDDDFEYPASAQQDFCFPAAQDDGLGGAAGDECYCACPGDDGLDAYSMDQDSVQSQGNLLAQTEAGHWGGSWGRPWGHGWHGHWGHRPWGWGHRWHGHHGWGWGGRRCWGGWC